MIEQFGNGLLLGIIISVASVALSLLYGVTRIVNFAHGEIIALGAIMTLFFSNPIDSRVLFLDRYSPLGMNFTFSIIISIIICGIFGGLLEIFLFKPLRKSEVGNIAVLVVTIGLSIFFRHIYLLFATGKVQNFPLDLERRQTYLFFDMTPRNFQVLIAGLAVMIFIGLFLSYTKIGKAMRAVRDSNELANISGINSDNIILFTWVSSSMLAGLAGIFQAIINDVRYNMGFLILLLIFAGTVLGGIGTSFGAMVGGFIIILKVSIKFLITLALTAGSIYLVFVLNEEGPFRILFNLLTFAGIYGLAAIGLNVHFGLTGLLNFGHASFMGVGAYVTLLLIPHAAGREGEITDTGLAFFPALIIGIIAAALFGLLLGLPAIRLRGDYLAIVTIAAAEIFRLLVRDLESITGGVYGIINFSDSLQMYRPNFVENFAENFELNSSQLWVGLLSWISIFFVLLLLKRLTNSPWGRALRAVREDEDAVRALGKNAVWLKLQSFMLGAGIAGLAGVLLAFNYGSLQTTTFVPLLTFYVWAIMILGGVGSLTGPIFGSIIFWVIISETDRLALLIFENANGQQLAGVRFVLVGLLIMFLMIFRPSGLLGKKEELLLDVKSS